MNLSGSDVSLGTSNYLSSSNHTYIQFYGGPNTSSVGSSVVENFSTSNIYDTPSNRGSNLAINPNNKGNTVEFWAKLDSNLNSFSNFKTNVFNVWNGVSPGDENCVFLSIELCFDSIAVLIRRDDEVGQHVVQYPLNFNKFTWNHYSIVFENETKVNSNNERTYIKIYINGQGMCVLFDGLFENISGVDSISLTTEIGSQIDGACLQCIPNLSQTPTPTPTNTPTPTPSVSPCVLYEYRVTNNSPSIVKFNYTNCSGSESGSVPSYSSVIICSTITPTSTSSNIVVVFLNTVCV